jgi:hypothetical protein
METPNIYFPKPKSNLLTILGVVAGVLLVIYLLLFIFTKREKRVDNEVIKQRIDSLNLVNQELVKKQNTLDSVTQEYNNRINDIDLKIKDIKKTKVIVREYYNDKIDASKRFSVDQADSFLKNRYNY